MNRLANKIGTTIESKQCTILHYTTLPPCLSVLLSRLECHIGAKKQPNRPASHFNSRLQATATCACVLVYVIMDIEGFAARCQPSEN